MTYQQAKNLLEEKNQTQLLSYYDELDEQGKANLLQCIENISWDFEDALKNPVDMSGKDHAMIYQKSNVIAFASLFQAQRNL